MLKSYNQSDQLKNGVLDPVWHTQQSRKQRQEDCLQFEATVGYSDFQASLSNNDTASKMQTRKLLWKVLTCQITTNPNGSLSSYR